VPGSIAPRPGHVTSGRVAPTILYSRTSPPALSIVTKRSTTHILSLCKMVGATRPTILAWRSVRVACSQKFRLCQAADMVGKRKRGGGRRKKGGGGRRRRRGEGAEEGEGGRGEEGGEGRVLRASDSMSPSSGPTLPGPLPGPIPQADEKRRRVFPLLASSWKVHFSPLASPPFVSPASSEINRWGRVLGSRSRKNLGGMGLTLSRS